MKKTIFVLYDVCPAAETSLVYKNINLASWWGSFTSTYKNLFTGGDFPWKFLTQLKTRDYFQMTKINKLIVCTHPLITSLQFICHNSILILTFCTVIFKPVILKNRRKLRYLAFQQTWCICFWASLFKAPSFSVRSSRANANCMGGHLGFICTLYRGEGRETRHPNPSSAPSVDLDDHWGERSKEGL